MKTIATMSTTSFATTMMLLGLLLLIISSRSTVDGAVPAAAAAAAAAADPVVIATETATTSSDIIFGGSGRDGNGGGREIVSFDFNWKFRKGLTDWPESNEEEPPIDTDPGFYPPEAAVDYDGTSNWLNVQLPHDGLIASRPSTKACPNGCSGRSYLPRNVLWYRKEFTIPQQWKIGDNSNDDDEDDYDGNNFIYLEFDGSFRNTTIWINGEYVFNHVCGYTPFRLRLDTIPSIIQNYHLDKSNSITVFVDPDNGDEGKSFVVVFV